MHALHSRIYNHCSSGAVEDDLCTVHVAVEPVSCSLWRWPRRRAARRWPGTGDATVDLPDLRGAARYERASRTTGRRHVRSCRAKESQSRRTPCRSFLRASSRAQCFFVLFYDRAINEHESQNDSKNVLTHAVLVRLVVSVWELSVPSPNWCRGDEDLPVPIARNLWLVQLLNDVPRMDSATFSSSPDRRHMG